MWEEMQAPIVPFVIFGAYDLYPVGSWVNSTGRVTVRYLPPLHPAEARDRDHMMRLVRRRMLESLRQCPPTMAHEISPSFYAASLLSNVAVTLLSVLLCRAAYEALAVRLQYSLLQITLGGSSLVLGITAALYVYYVYVVDSGTAAGILNNQFNCSEHFLLSLLNFTLSNRYTSKDEEATVKTTMDHSSDTSGFILCFYFVRYLF